MMLCGYFFFFFIIFIIIFLLLLLCIIIVVVVVVRVRLILGHQATTSLHVALQNLARTRRRAKSLHPQASQHRILTV